MKILYILIFLVIPFLSHSQIRVQEKWNVDKGYYYHELSKDLYCGNFTLKVKLFKTKSGVIIFEGFDLYDITGVSCTNRDLLTFTLSDGERIEFIGSSDFSCKGVSKYRNDVDFLSRLNGIVDRITYVNGHTLDHYGCVLVGEDKFYFFEVNVLIDNDNR